MIDNYVKVRKVIDKSKKRQNQGKNYLFDMIEKTRRKRNPSLVR